MANTRGRRNPVASGESGSVQRELNAPFYMTSKKRGILRKLSLPIRSHVFHLLTIHILILIFCMVTALVTGQVTFQTNFMFL